MPAKHSCHIALTGPLADYVEAQVAKGENFSASDLIRTAIRLPMAQDEAKTETCLGKRAPSRQDRGSARTDG